MLRGELDRWALIFRNPHFADIRRAWSAGQSSDFKALSEAERLIRGRSQVFKIYNSFSPSLALTADSACRVLYGDIESKADPLFTSIRQLTPSPAVQIRVAQIRYAAMIETAREGNAEKIEQTMQRSHEAEEQVLSEARAGVLNLPAPQVTCGNMQAAQTTQIKF